MKSWKIIADKSPKSRLELGLGLEPWSLAGGRFGLLTRIATAESGLLRERLKS
jgi:hypothetical protein